MNHRRLGRKIRRVTAGLLVLGLARTAAGEEFRANIRGPARVQTRFSFAPDFTRLDYRLRLQRGTGIETARLHCAPPGTPGPPIVDLLRPTAGGWNAPLRLASTLTEANIGRGGDCAATLGFPIASVADLAYAMEQGGIYLSLRFPAGEARGRVRSLAPLPPPAADSPRLRAGAGLLQEPQSQPGRLAVRTTPKRGLATVRVPAQSPPSFLSAVPVLVPTLSVGSTTVIVGEPLAVVIPASTDTAFGTAAPTLNFPEPSLNFSGPTLTFPTVETRTVAPAVGVAVTAPGAIGSVAQPVVVVPR
jgi:hypothetical protein